MNKYLISFITLMVIVTFVWAFNFPFNHPLSFEIKGVFYVEQPDGITCGPTSALMVLRRYGKDVTLDQVKAESKTKWFEYKGKSIGMTSPEYVFLAMNKLGIRTHLMRGDLKRLKYFVSQSRPVIVLLRSGELTWHYVVVIGYDEEAVIVADPGWGKRIVISNESFLSSWSFDTDMRGNEVGNESLVFLLKVGEVYPDTMIVPWRSLSR